MKHSNKIYRNKILLSVIGLLLLTIILPTVNAAPVIGTTVYGSDRIYLQVCCVENEYKLDKNTDPYNTYFTLPVQVNIWDNNLKDITINAWITLNHWNTYRQAWETYNYTGMAGITRRAIFSIPSSKIEPTSYWQLVVFNDQKYGYGYRTYIKTFRITK